MTRRSLFVPFFASLGIVGGVSFGVACTGQSAAAGPQDAAADSPASTLCSTDPRAQTFSAGMEQVGTSGALKVRLLSVDPQPPVKGSNTWTIQVVDASGAPVDGATITLKPFMPDHGHGSSITPQIQPVGSEGKYTVSLISLSMPGVWQMIFLVTTPTKTDTATFTFCIVG